MKKQRFVSSQKPDSRFLMANKVFDGQRGALGSTVSIWVFLELGVYLTSSTGRPNLQSPQHEKPAGVSEKQPEPKIKLVGL